MDQRLRPLCSMQIQAYTTIRSVFIFPLQKRSNHRMNNQNSQDSAMPCTWTTLKALPISVKHYRNPAPPQHMQSWIQLRANSWSIANYVWNPVTRQHGMTHMQMSWGVSAKALGQDQSQAPNVWPVLMRSSSLTTMTSRPTRKASLPYQGSLRS